VPAWPWSSWSPKLGITVADFVYGRFVALAVAIPLGIGSLWMWFGLPLWRRVHGDPPAP
jgi:hypothetical protein